MIDSTWVIIDFCFLPKITKILKYFSFNLLNLWKILIVYQAMLSTCYIGYKALIPMFALKPFEYIIYKIFIFITCEQISNNVIFISSSTMYAFVFILFNLLMVVLHT